MESTDSLSVVAFEGLQCILTQYPIDLRRQEDRAIIPPNRIGSNRSLLSSGGLMADVPCLDHSLDSCKGRPDDVQTTKHARRTHAWSRCARTSLGVHASLFGASGARFWIVTRAMSARIEEPSMVSILYIKSSIPDTYK